jgi:hypothetical protein
MFLGIVADEGDEEVFFHTNYSHSMPIASVSTLSLLEDETHRGEDLHDFSAYMDQVISTSGVAIRRLSIS